MKLSKIASVLFQKQVPNGKPKASKTKMSLIAGLIVAALTVANAFFPNVITDQMVDTAEALETVIE